MNAEHPNAQQKTSPDPENLRGFYSHGVELVSTLGDQAVCRCVWCGKPKMYINMSSLLWDCKVCGKKGNFGEFLTQRSEDYREQISEKLLKSLGEDRGLPVEAFKGFRIGWDGKSYILPILNGNGNAVDLRRYKTGKKLMTTAGAQVGLLGLGDVLRTERAGEPVYICEGEWDAMAWRWMLKKLEKPGVVVGVPGAGVFKVQWAGFFRGRDVRVLYDHDQAGIDGELRVLNVLTGTVKKLQFLHWGDGLPTKFDIRDLVKTARKEDDLTKAYMYVKRNLMESPRSRAVANPSGDENLQKPVAAESIPPISVKKLMEEYQKWLHLPNTDVLKIIFGTVIANYLEGEPVWMFLIAPPGGSKSELLMSLSASDRVHALTSLTPHTLISGSNWSAGKDPSLLPQLDKKILIIKDFTTILTMHYSVRDEIFGTLRDVYDGSTTKSFGNGITRSYQVQFGVLAGVTPVIETFNILHSSLGERFLKFRITGNWDMGSEDQKIRRALQNFGKEVAMRKGLQLAAKRYLAHLKIPTGDKVPRLSSGVLDSVVALSKFTARMRGVVDRDRFSQQVMYKPSSEVGTRISKQLGKLGSAIAIFLEKKTVDEEVYRLLRRIALDTVPDRNEDVVRAIWKLGGEKGLSVGTSEVGAETRLPQSTVFRILQDLHLLKIVDRIADKKMVASWKLSKAVSGHVHDGKIYSRGETDKRFGQGGMKIKVKEKEIS